ncbi:MAG: phenylalanine--tRNA ligase subunit beta [Steroidobacteraceae bacterium]
MKLPLSWLKEWVDCPWEPAELGRRLTMAGFELEAIAPAAPPFSKVVVAQIVSCERHPQADKLQVCQVDAGGGEMLQIVCGAPNARAGLKAPLACVGAGLPGDLKIKAARLRGVESAGMLCSARELGLSEAAAGLLELPADAPVGTDLRDYLQLDDTILELAVTPNRGDAMSVLGIAREVAALAGLPLKNPVADTVPVINAERHGVRVEPGIGVGRFVTQVFTGVDNTAPSPGWLVERLRRAGLRSISRVVDVTNYVLMELGQPMHAYDRARVRGDLQARRAQAGEALTLLDGREVKLDADMLVIADQHSAIGLAGVMGGQRTAVSAETREVVLEVAWFAPDAVAGRGRRLGLVTDASQRFERGVDPALQERAITRAGELLMRLTRAQGGPVEVNEQRSELPQRAPITLRAARLKKLLGTDVPASEVQARLLSLGLKSEAFPDAWRATPPSWRFDLTIEADLIEEIVRLRGLDTVPEAHAQSAVRLRPLPESLTDERSVLQLLAARGYQEVITFGFVDPQLQDQLFPPAQRGVAGIGQAPVKLTNPIASNLAVMRSSLWPGLINAALENQRRQQERLRLFEIGARFMQGADGKGLEQRMISALVSGSRAIEQWGQGKDGVDFFDVKGDIEALLALSGAREEFRFEPAQISCLHPGRTAVVRRNGERVGFIGELHPDLVRQIDLTYVPILVELDYALATQGRVPAFQPLSRFPQIRRDISCTVPADVSIGSLRDRVSVVAAAQLRELRLFDLYQGPGVETGRKSVAFGLILQDFSRTLTDEEADHIVAAVAAELRDGFDGKIRE